MTQHKWKPTTLNHGTMQCEYCHCTEREAAFALGMECSRAPATPPTPAIDEREAVSVAIQDALCKGNNLTDAALSALAQVRAAEILAAEANERARIAAFYRANGAGSWDTFEAFARAIERNEHGAGK